MSHRKPPLPYSPATIRVGGEVVGMIFMHPTEDDMLMGSIQTTQQEVIAAAKRDLPCPPLYLEEEPSYQSDGQSVLVLSFKTLFLDQLVEEKDHDWAIKNPRGFAKSMAMEIAKGIESDRKKQEERVEQAKV